MKFISPRSLDRLTVGRGLAIALVFTVAVWPVASALADSSSDMSSDASSTQSSNQDSTQDLSQASIQGLISNGNFQSGGSDYGNGNTGDNGNGNHGNQNCDNDDSYNGNSHDNSYNNDDHGNDGQNDCDNGHGGDNGDHGDHDHGGGNGWGNGGGSGSGSTTPAVATTTLSVTLSNDPTGPAVSGDFTLLVIDSTTTLLAGAAQDSQNFILNQGDTYSVTEATTSGSIDYSIALDPACSGTAGANAISCPITNTWLGTTTTSTSTSTPTTTPETGSGSGDNGGGSNGGSGDGSTGGSSGSGSNTSSSGFGIPSSGGGYVGPITGGPNQGQVLGASIGPSTGAACGIFLAGYVKPDGQNKLNDIVDLQIFLRQYEGDSLAINGIYDQATEAAVNAFQTKYNTEILKPWSDLGLLPNDTSPTGYVYKTTRRMINNIVCPSLNLPIPQLP
jgi:hypothetical protein